MIKNIGIVLNPTAGRGKAGRIFPQVLSMLHEAGIKTLVEITEFPGQATELAVRLAKNGVDAVVSAGGDGTVNEVLNGWYSWISQFPWVLWVLAQAMIF